jgi:hypothetical protein
MAILHMSGFEYSTTVADFGIGVVNDDGKTYVQSTARTGNRGIEADGPTAFGNPPGIWYPVTSLTTVWTQGAFRLYQAGDKQTSDYRFGIVQFLNYTSGWNPSHVGVGFDFTTGQLVVVHGNGGAGWEANNSVIFTSTETALVPNNVWHFLEVKATIGTSSSLFVRLNGVVIVDLSGLYTKNPDISGTVNRVAWRSSNGLITSRVYFDDIMVGDASGGVTSPPGDCRIEYLPPNASGARADWTPTSGSNYSTVSELTPNDSTYNSSNVVGAMDLLNMQNLSGSGTVYAVQSVTRARKDDAGARLVRPLFRIDDGDTPAIYSGSDASLTTTAAYSRELFEESPGTSSAWTIDEVNAMQFGYQVSGSEFFTLSAEIAGF